MKFAKCLSALFFASFLSLFSGCSGLFSGSLGYSVLLWSNSEHNVQDGAILKVYIKSNISQVYVVSFPKSKEKFEIPLWQITEPESKGKALRQQARFADFAHTYASVKLGAFVELILRGIAFLFGRRTFCFIIGYIGFKFCYRLIKRNNFGIN